MPLSSFTLDFLGFIGINATVLLSGTLFTLRLLNYKMSDLAKFTLTLFLMVILQIFTTQIFLGVLGELTYTNLWIINIGIMATTLAIFGKETLRNIELPNIKKMNPWIFLLIFTPFLIVFFLRYTNALFQIPLEYDNVAYHLPFVVEWFKSGNLLEIYYSAYAGPLGYYPAAYELIDLWVIMPFGNDLLINFINLPIFPILILAIYAVCRNFKFSTTTSLITAGLFIYMPQTFRQIGVPLVDVFFTLAFVLAIYFLQEFNKTKSIREIFLFAVAAGIFIGTKYLGIPYILPLAITAFIITWKKFKNAKKFTTSTIVMGFSTILSGGFFYIRNWIDSGNPLFPVEVKLLGIKIFEGYHGLTERLLNYSLLSNVKSIETLKEFLYGFFLMTGIQSFLILLASIILLALFIKNIIKKEKSEAKIHLLIGLSLIFYFFMYFKAPYTYKDLIPNVRYSMMFLVLGSITVGYIFEKIKKTHSLLLPISISIFLINLFFLILKTPERIIKNDKLLIDYEIFFKYPEITLLSLALTLLTAISLISFTQIKEKNNKKIAISSALAIVILTFFILSETAPKRENLANHYAKFWHESQIHPSNYEIMEAALWLDKTHPDSKIAYTGFNFHYHLFGRNLQREVSYININECENCKYIDYKTSKNSIRRNPDYDNWTKNLTSKNKELLITAPTATEGVENFESAWAPTHPEKFEKIYETNQVQIYKIK